MLHKVSVAFGAVVLGLSAPALAVVDTTTYNSTPDDGFHYGTDNDYSPANAAVLTSDTTELALRLHESGEVAPASDGSGVYTFALGTPISFDWSIDGPGDNSLITLTNLGTGQHVSYDPLCPVFIGICLSDNYSGAPDDADLAQNSERLDFSFLSGLGFDANVNDTYQVNLTADGHSLNVFAQLGSGAPAVPEPATWAMMLLGFGMIGFSMRRVRSNMRVSLTA